MELEKIKKKLSHEIWICAIFQETQRGGSKLVATQQMSGYILEETHGNAPQHHGVALKVSSASRCTGIPLQAGPPCSDTAPP